jgi:class 3 adenylate cyclase/tetratricopeptide (TPR) repeat protein
MAQPDRDRLSLRAARRRHLTILFSDLSEFTALTGSVEPEYCVEVVDHLKRCADRVITKHGGIVVSFRGDGVMAMFGYPEPRDDDGRRATEAALELHKAIGLIDASEATRTMLPPLKLHSGVHCGLVLLIENDPGPGEYALMGEPPNIAARLSDAAASDEILVSAATLSSDRHFFEIRDRGELALHGKSAPVAVIQVLSHARAHTRYQARTERGLTPFVGRARELELLDRHLSRVLAGESLTVGVVAPAGVGKTRLVEQFLGRAYGSNVQVYRGYCESYLAAEPRQPFLQIMRQLGGVEENADTADVQAALSQVRAALTSGGTTPSDAAALALAELFAAAARQKPLILFIDDWQWADDATKQVLAAVRQIEHGSLLIVITTRDPLPAAAAGASELQVLPLTPFREDETLEAVLRLRPDADPFSTKQIQERSGGNPLFIEELCHWSAREPASRSVDRGDSTPAWLSTLIESRVEQLPAQQADIVRAAAVIGAVVPAWLLEQLTGCGDRDPELIELAERDLIFPGEVPGTLRFKHGITRDVVYASVGLREREGLHRRIGELLERRGAEDGLEPLLEPLSYHFRAASDHQRAAHYAELAGDKALAAAAPDRARGQYASALAALDALPPSDDGYARWSSIVHRFGLACVFDPARDQLALFTRASRLAQARTDETGLARAEYWLGFIHYALGDPGDAIEHYERARVHCARALDAAGDTGHQPQAIEMQALGVQLLATIGQARASAGQPEIALQLLDAALGVKRRHRRSEHPAVGSAYALACKGAVLGHVGRFVEAYTCFDEALESIHAGHSAVEASVLGWCSAVCLWHGRWAEAHECATRAQHLAQRAGSLYVLAQGQAVAAYAGWMLERSPDAFDAIARATSWLERHDKRLGISMNYGWLADVAAVEERDVEVRLYAARALRRARHRDLFGEPMAYRALAVTAGRRRSHAADDYLARAMASSVNQGSPREQAVTLLQQGEHAVRTGRRGEAVDRLTRARAAFASLAMPWHDAAAVQCLEALPGAGSAV